MAASLKNAFLRFAQQQKLFDQNRKILIALSGGVDSMVLLHLLMEWRQNLSLSLAAVHINHQLRGKESDLDQEFVRDFCEKQSIKIYLEKVNTREFAKRNKFSIEEAGHILRKQVYGGYLKDRRFDVVATAHNLDDQAETILMHILEGTGLDGLAGIHLQRKGIVRPLLFAARQDIERYANKKNIPYREDQSNEDLRFKRNKIRHQLLPFLEREFSLRKLDNFLKMGLILQEWFYYAEKYVEALRKKVTIEKQKAIVKVSDFQKQISGIQLKLLEDVLQHITGSIAKLDFNTFQGFKTWVEANKEGTKFQLYPGVLVNRLQKSLIFQRISKAPFKIKLEIQSENVYNLSESGIHFILKEVTPGQVKFTDNHSVEFVDREKIHFPLILRNWKSGDKFQPLGSAFNRLVSDFLTDLKIEFPRKKNVLILEERGGIVAIPNFQIGEKYKLTPKTKRVLRIELRDKKQYRDSTDR